MKMKRLIKRFPAIVLLSGLFAMPALAQTSAEEITANLRAQLSEVQLRQAELQTRNEQLEEDLRPENIERSLAGIGSTHPEQLREQRRRQLEIARTRVRLQLDELGLSAARLEKAITEADAAAYWQSAGIVACTTQGIDKLP